MSNNYHEWADNEDITVDALNRLDKWKVNYFTDATDRDAVITSPEEGMIIYLTSVHRHQYWTGATWAYLTNSAPDPISVSSDVTLSGLLTALQTQGLITVTSSDLHVKIFVTDNTGAPVESQALVLGSGGVESDAVVPTTGLVLTRTSSYVNQYSWTLTAPGSSQTVNITWGNPAPEYTIQLD